MRLIPHTWLGRFSLLSPPRMAGERRERRWLIYREPGSSATPMSISTPSAAARFSVLSTISSFYLRPTHDIIAIRSAARLGHSDFGVNRKRVEKLRLLLRNQGVIR